MALCVALYSLMMAAIWPLFNDDSLQQMMEQMAQMMPGVDTEAFSMSIGEYLDTQWLGIYWLPMVGAVMIVIASKAIAGGSRDGSLETIFVYPIARTTYLSTCILALIAVALILSLATMLPLVVIGPAFEITLEASTYLLLIVAAFLVLLVFGLFVLAISSFSRGLGIPAGVAVGFLLVMMVLLIATPYVEALEILEPLNLLHWWGSGRIIDEGSAEVGLWIYLGVVGGVSLLVSYVSFLRRDLV